MTFPEALRRFRKDNGLTQKQVAEAIGIREAVYQRYEQNKAAPSVNVVMKIADVFKVPLDYLVGRDDDAKNTNEFHLLAIYRNLDENNRRTLTDMANFLNIKQSFSTENEYMNVVGRNHINF